MAERPLVLTVDDDPELVALINLKVGRWGFDARGVGSPQAMWQILDQCTPAVMLVDVVLGEIDGSRLVAEIKERWPEIEVISITRRNTVEVAVQCMKNGAADFITKPLDFERLRSAVEAAIQVAEVRRRWRADSSAEPPLHGLIGRCQAMEQLYGFIRNVAPADVSTLILGETGTGKELVARAIHQASGRSEGPFVAVNAAAIPHELVESMLFGHERGAFTGARQDHVGYCEQADGGTLFLDEIGEMDFEVQAKLLRFLQDHVVQRVGSVRSRKVDVRVVAATNARPQEQMAQKRLREDLYYRLRVVSFELPPLRQRQGDVELLATHFLHQACERFDRRFESISAQALAVLTAYPWPGNVRQLKSIIEEAVVMNQGETLTAPMLSTDLLSSAGSDAMASSEILSGHGTEKRLSAKQLREKQRLIAALERSEGRVEEAAAELGISRATIYRRLKKYHLS